MHFFCSAIDDNLPITTTTTITTTKGERGEKNSFKSSSIVSHGHERLIFLSGPVGYFFFFFLFLFRGCDLNATRYWIFILKTVLHRFTTNHCQRKYRGKDQHTHTHTHKSPNKQRCWEEEKKTKKKMLIWLLNCFWNFAAWRL